MTSSAGPFVDLTADLPGAHVLPARADVVVVGGGLTGVAVALFLAEGGAEVALLEALPGVGRRGSGRHAGIVEPGLTEHPHRTIASLGDARARELLAMGERNLDLFDERGLLERCGSTWAALDRREPAEIEQSAAALVRLGFQAEVLDSGEADRRTGAFNLGPALLRPTGGRIDPGAAVRALAAGAEAAGAVLVGGARVDRITEVDDGVAVGFPGGVVTAEAVVLAAGLGCEALDPTLAGRIQPVREQGLLSAPVFAWYPAPFRAGQGWTTARQLPDGHLVVTGCRWASAHLEAGERDDTVIVDRIQAKLEAFLRFHFKAAAETSVVDRWAWVDGTGTDGLPYVGPLPGSSRRIACCAFGGNGAGFQLAAARGVADGLLTGDADLPEWLSPGRITAWR